MRIFRVDSAEERLSAVTAPVLVSARPTPATLERQIQSLCEKNLLQLFGLEFIASEFTVRNVRLDTFAFDPESNSYVISEYKRGASLSIIDQGFTYLSLLQNNPEAFVLKHAESKSLLMKMQDIDWRKSRVFFVSPDFTA